MREMFVVAHLVPHQFHGRKDITQQDVGGAKNTRLGNNACRMWHGTRQVLMSIGRLNMLEMLSTIAAGEISTGMVLRFIPLSMAPIAAAKKKVSSSHFLHLKQKKISGVRHSQVCPVRKCANTPAASIWSRITVLVHGHHPHCPFFRFSIRAALGLAEIPKIIRGFAAIVFACSIAV